MWTYETTGVAVLTPATTAAGRSPSQIYSRSVAPVASVSAMMLTCP
ncbi:hypothetical protein ACNHKD_03815 [Methylocystis sp. JAN1]